MDRFHAMQVFVRVVEANSFTRAADSLALPRTTISTVIQNLERHLNVRLLNRTTRRISLTPDGACYYTHCVRILAEVEETEACFHDASINPRGRLRVETPDSIGRQILIPSLHAFYARYPDIELAIGMSDRQVDLVQEAVDCTIRCGELEDSSLVARRIGMLKIVTCASPAYLERKGVPHTLKDLEQHHGVHSFGSNGRDNHWHFMIDGKALTVPSTSMVSVNDCSAHLSCGLQGLGLIQTSRYMALPHLQSGELIEVLSHWNPAPVPMSLLYLQRNQLSPRVRAFSDWITDLFACCPLLNGGDENDHGTCEHGIKHPELSESAALAALAERRGMSPRAVAAV